MHELKYILLIFFCGLLHTTRGQEVIWASKVLGYSSEYRPGAYGQQYRATQILGAPDRLPDTGDSPCAWTPSVPDGTAEEWIKVGFEEAVRLRQVIVAENFNPGAITRIYVYDRQGREYLFAEGTRLRQTGEPGRLLHVVADSVFTGGIVALKLVLNPSLVAGFNQIDAVGLSESATPVKVAVEVASDMPSHLRKINLGRTVNSGAKEVAPVVSPDGNTLYFTRSDDPRNIGTPARQDVWVTTRDEKGAWRQAENIGPPVNNGGDNAVVGISSGGNTLYLLNVYKPDGTMVQGFSKSHKTAAGWSFPVPFTIEDHYNDQRTNNTELAVAPGERVLVLSVQRRDSYGSKDFYVCFLKPSGTWSAPVNMGAELNTADYEGTPYIAADGKTLYFTSLGHRGYGNGDIFMARRLDDTWLRWTKPLNLGPAINTPEWDGYFSIPASGAYAYMSSSVNSVQSDDIFQVDLYPSVRPERLMTIAGKLVDGSTGETIPGEIRVNRPGDTEVLTSATYDPKAGDFSISVPGGEILSVTARNDGYFPATDVIEPGVSPYAQAISKTITLFPLRGGQRIHLRQIRFAQSSSVIDSTSFAELDQLGEIMRKYPQMEILLEGHTDNQGDFNKNLKLSEERVISVRNYLEASGIDTSRIHLKAWGPSRPLGNNLTEESRRRNRRVELTILKI